MSRVSQTDRAAREESFWDERVRSLDSCVREYDAGPDPNTSLLLDTLEPLNGKSVLDIGCGNGVLSAWLARRGGRVTGIDISPESVTRADELAAELGFEIEFVADSFPSRKLDGRRFDRLAGKLVLHHLDLVVAAPALGHHLAVGGSAAFVETMATNPLLRAARASLVGRLGIPRLGTLDERPLGWSELALLRAAVGPLRREVGQTRFLRILDRQVFRYRSAGVSRVCGLLDDRVVSLAGAWASYHQVVVFPGGRR